MTEVQRHLDFKKNEVNACFIPANNGHRYITEFLNRLMDPSLLQRMYPSDYAGKLYVLTLEFSHTFC